MTLPLVTEAWVFLTVAIAGLIGITHYVTSDFTAAVFGSAMLSDESFDAIKSDDIVHFRLDAVKLKVYSIAYERYRRQIRLLVAPVK